MICRPRRPRGARKLLIVAGLELLADDLAQKPRRRRDPLVLDQLVVLLDCPQRTRRVDRDLTQQLHPGSPVLPVAGRLSARLAVVKAKPRAESVGALAIGDVHRVDQLSDSRAHERRGVLHRRRSQHRRRVEDLLRRPRDQPELARQLERPLEDESLLAVQQQPGTEANQRARMKAGVVNRQVERDLEAQVKAHRVHRALIREPVAVGEQQHLGEHARRDRRPPLRTRIALREVLVADDPITVLSKQRIDRALRQQIRTPCRIEKPLLPIRRRKHPQPP